ncbi:hypothetical protein JCM14469_21240 [Desulfatiferula olefinivorans]
MVLEDSGIDPDRFDLQWVSSAEAPRFARLVTDFTKKIRALGPNLVPAAVSVASEQKKTG